MRLQPCALCANMEDPRYGAWLGEHRFPLCEACGGPETQEQRASLFARLRGLPKPPSIWRTGRTLGRTIYLNDKCVGMVDTPELAAEIVAAMNRRQSTTGLQSKSNEVK